MKPKVFSKKLNLNKKTIAHLNGNEMKDVHGGKCSNPVETVDVCPVTLTLECCLPNTDCTCDPTVSPPYVCPCNSVNIKE